MLECERGSGSLGLRMEVLERLPRLRMQKAQQSIAGDEADRPLTVDIDKSAAIEDQAQRNKLSDADRDACGAPRVVGVVPEDGTEDSRAIQRESRDQVHQEYHEIERGEPASQGVDRTTHTQSWLPQLLEQGSQHETRAQPGQSDQHLLVR